MEHMSKLTRLNRPSLLSFSTPKELWAFALNYVVAHRLQDLNAAWRPIRCRNVSGLVSESDFLKEYTWVVYVSGFSARVVSSFFDKLLIAHGLFRNGQVCRWDDQDHSGAVFSINKNRAKYRAVQHTWRLLATMGWGAFSDKFIRKPDPGVLRELKGIGPALSFHLARNLGNIQCVKPDVHLNRLASHFGLASAEELCRSVNPAEPAGFTDLVLWMAAVDCGTRP